MFTLTIDDAGIARIAIDRPDARNAVTVAGWHRLAELAAEAARAWPKAVLLHAAPGALFCAGADLKELAELGDQVHRRAPFRTAMADAFAGLRALPMPTIAVIERGCYGAGVALAMACDLRVASADARFAIPPAKLGILYPPDDVRRLTELVGEGHAIRLLASGDVIDAGEAARIGLVEIVAADARGEAEALAARIAANAAASVVKLKAFVRPGAPPPAYLFDDAFGSPEFAGARPPAPALAPPAPAPVPPPVPPVAAARPNEAFTRIEGELGVLIVADHASNHVPDDIDLGIDPALLDQHMAVDIGVAPLAAKLCARLGCAAILGGSSRLVLDLNREADSPGLIPTASDGHAIPGNAGADREGRLRRFWLPYHGEIAAIVNDVRPALLISLHSFTPRLASAPEVERPWQVGILYNRDDRAARIAIPALAAAGIVTGDNEPYSGRHLNATMNLHAEANGIPYLGLEVRQDLIADEAGVERWCDVLTSVVIAVVGAV